MNFRLPPRASLAWLCFIVAFFTPPLRAAVTAFHVTDRSPVLDGKNFGSVGPYERISGTAQFAVDPKAAVNQAVTDIGLAPRDPQGKVEFSADIYILQPRNPAKSNGTALLQISNRGGKGLLSTFDFAKGALDPRTPAEFGDQFLLEQGFTLVWVGWEFDVPAEPHRLRVQVPVATDHGKTITGMICSEWIGAKPANVIALGGKYPGYPAASGAASENDPADKLLVRDTFWGPLRTIPRNQWKFTDRTHVALSSGFQPGKTYDVVYRAKNPVVAGLGLAAVRDFISYMKYGNPQTSPQWNVKRTIAFGISQSGRFLREFLYDGFNEDEQHRRVFDGVWAHVAGGGRGSFNVRFAQPSQDVRSFLDIFSPADLPPFTDRELLAKETRTGTAPKLFLTNGSSEYWDRCASLIQTTPDGKSAATPLPNTRLYFFAGAQHSMGSLPPHDVGARSPASINDYRCALRALLLDMQAWIKDGKQPPPSRIPDLAKGQLVALSALDFPKIPGIHAPRHMREAWRMDYSTMPPKLGPPFPTLVPQVNSDGNESSGIAMPEIAVPLGTSTGWNLPKTAHPAGDEFALAGSYIPFAKTKQEREVKHDPRPSIAERYPSEDAYLQAITAAATRLVGERLLLERDIPRLRARAEKEWNYAHASQ